MLDAFRRGETQALTRVYRGYAERVARHLARSFSVRSSNTMSRIRLTTLDLEDAHQETFVRAFREHNRLAYDGLRPYEVFLFTIARSAAIDLLRSKGKVAHNAVAVDDEEARTLELPTDGPSPEEQTLSAELRTIVQAFLNTLDPRARKLAVARFVEGKSQEIAAAELGFTRSEVRTREKHLRENFAKHLAQVGWPESKPGSGSGSGSGSTSTASNITVASSWFLFLLGASALASARLKLLGGHHGLV